jgi:RNA polymerase sigma-70 factor (ECF subfamily)
MTLAAKPEGLLESRMEGLLTRKCVEGDQNAWGALHRHYFPTALSFLRRLGVKEGDLEDASQEVFLQMFRYLPTFRAESELRTWFYQLCITQARQTRRTYSVRAMLDKILARSGKIFVSDVGPSEHAAELRIQAALSKLSEPERVVFVLYELDGLSGKEIAAIVGDKENTVWRRLHYARKNFRIALGFEPEEEP